MSHAWKVVQTDSAKQDYAHIISWTVNRFGHQQARTYGQSFHLAFTELKDGPGLLGVKKRDNLGAGIPEPLTT